MSATAVVLTGGTSGLGRATATILARSDIHQLVLAARDEAAARRLAADLSARAPHPVLTAPLDLASLASVRAFPRALDAIGVSSVGALVCKAGVQDVRRIERTADGFERTFAVNHSAHMGLSLMLLPSLVADAKLVFVSSNTHDPTTKTGMPAPRMEDAHALALGTEASGDPVRAGRVRYTTSKLCNVLCAAELARRLNGSSEARLRGVRVASFDPGMMPGTGLARSYGRLFARSCPGETTVLHRLRTAPRGRVTRTARALSQLART